jgi:hypothetical protein
MFFNMFYSGPYGPPPHMSVGLEEVNEHLPFNGKL